MEVNNIKKAKKTVGPGVITGGADNDPAGIVTYTIVGATTGYVLLWLMFIITPMLIVVQEMASRVALVKRKGLASVIKEHYGVNTAKIVMIVLIIANIATIGADIAGISSVMGMITGISWVWFIIPLTLVIWYIILFQSYKSIRRILLGLAFLMGIYIISALLAKPEWTSIASGFVPHFNFSFVFLAAAVGMIGTTISPYILFWQASEELEEKKPALRMKTMETDTIIGMTWSNIVSVFIIIASAAVLFGTGIFIETPEQAAIALQPLAGQWAYLLFAIGILIVGFLAIPVLAGSTAYAVSETFGWKEGLDKKVSKAKGFYAVITLSFLVGIGLAFSPVNPFHFLFYTQILNGLLMPFLVLLLFFMCNNRKIMGCYVNSKLKNIITIALLVILGFLDTVLILQVIEAVV